MLVTPSLHPSEAMDKLAAAHESAGDVERAESLYLRMLAWREGADQFQAGDGAELLEVLRWRSHQQIRLFKSPGNIYIYIKC